MSHHPNWFDLWDVERRYHELSNAREELLQAAVLTGEEITILGSPARIRVEWVNGTPVGMTNEQLREYGEKIKAAAMAKSQ